MKKKEVYQPKPVFTEAFPEISGNTVNGRGEIRVRKATPFFWHPPAKQTHGELQAAVLSYHQQAPEICENFSANPPGGRGPPIQPCSTGLPKTDKFYSGTGL